MHVSRRKTRTPFFLMAISRYSFATIVFFATDTRIMFLPALGYVCVTLILMIIDVFWKISVHCAGVAGPIAALSYVFGIIVAPLFLLLVPLSWARVALKEHTFKQTLVGCCTCRICAIVSLGWHLFKRMLEERVWRSWRKGGFA